MKIKRGIKQTENYLERIETNFEKLKRQINSKSFEIIPKDMEKLLTYFTVLERKIEVLEDTIRMLSKRKALSNLMQ